MEQNPEEEVSEVVPNNTDNLEVTGGDPSLDDYPNASLSNRASVQGGWGAFGFSGWATNSWNVILDSIGMQKFMSKDFNGLNLNLNLNRLFK